VRKSDRGVREALKVGKKGNELREEKGGTNCSNARTVTQKKGEALIGKDR